MVSDCFLKSGCIIYLDVFQKKPKSHLLIMPHIIHYGKTHWFLVGYHFFAFFWQSEGLMVTERCLSLNLWPSHPQTDPLANSLFLNEDFFPFIYCLWKSSHFKSMVFLIVKIAGRRPFSRRAFLRQSQLEDSWSITNQNKQLFKIKNQYKYEKRCFT